MIQPIVKDPFILSRKSVPATNRDQDVIRDLEDTLRAHQDHCIGMAANMIGQLKRIMIVSDGKVPLVLVNPKILARSDPYETEEGCLSLEGVRPVTRYRKIVVSYQDRKFRSQKKTFTGITAQAIQHEYDHMDGILI